MSDTSKTRRRTGTRGKAAEVWTDEERAAMTEHAREMKTAKRRGKADKQDGEADVQEKIAEMPEPDRVMAERIHAIVKASAPQLTPRTWYGMPAYANADGKVVCFFTPAAKFKERYATLGFNADANLDEGTMWPTAWALTKLSAANEATISDLVKKAVKDR
jgi:uncharacterized protein YdhG (YjbR/CyaY superfamily)